MECLSLRKQGPTTKDIPTAKSRKELCEEHTYSKGNSTVVLLLQIYMYNQKEISIYILLILFQICSKTVIKETCFALSF